MRTSDNLHLISEVSDSMTIVVSEETGAVSLAVEGTLYRNIDANFLKSKLRFAAKLSKDTEPYLTKLKRSAASGR